jgi:hypothetical protein
LFFLAVASHLFVSAGVMLVTGFFSRDIEAEFFHYAITEELHANEFIP